MKEIFLAFDLPRELTKEKVKVNRDLHKLGAKRVQHSLWKSNNLKGLIDIAMFIKNSGGTARVLEEKLIFA